MARLVEFASWALFILLGVVFLAEGWAALSIPYLLLLFLAIFLRFSIRVVKEYDRLVVFRVDARILGRQGARSHPGSSFHGLGDFCGHA